MKERTINGLNVEEAMARFREYKKPTERKEDKYPYYDIREYVQRLDAAFGLHYTVTGIAPPQYIRLDNRQEILSAGVRLSVFDDERQLVTYRDGYAGCELLPAKATGKDSGINNWPRNAETAALKAACCLLGIFGYYGETPGTGAERAVTERTAHAGDAGRKKPAAGQAAGQREMTFSYMKEAGCRMEPAGSSKNPATVYRLVARPIAAGEPYSDGKRQVVDLVVYHNRIAEGSDAACFRTLQAKIQAGEDKFLLPKMKVRIGDTRNGYRQLIFMGMAQAEINPA